MNQVRYSLTKYDFDKYFGTGRINNLQTLPSYWCSVPTLGGATLYLYPLPNIAYDFQIQAKFRLSPVTQFQDLSLTLEQNYWDYLTFALAKRMCILQGFPVPDDVRDELSATESNIRNLMTPLDYTMKRMSTLTRSGRYGVPNPALSQLFEGWFSG